MLYVVGIGELTHSHLVYWKSLENIEYKSKGNKQSNPGVSSQNTFNAVFPLSFFQHNTFCGT